MLFRELLTSEGYSVRTASNGAAALQVVDEPGGWLPDVILLDVDMPVMDGYAFGRAYRERCPGTPHAPIIVVTAAVHPEQAAERVGAVASIRKPFHLEEVLGAVRLHQPAA